MKKAIIIVGHGSRDGGNDTALKRMAEELQRSGAEIIEYAYLQYAQPTVDAALEQCIRQGAKEIVVVPFFMQAGAHVTRDIPGLLNKARSQHPDCAIRATDYVGAHPLMKRIVMDLANNIKY